MLEKTRESIGTQEGRGDERLEGRKTHPMVDGYEADFSLQIH